MFDDFCIAAPRCGSHGTRFRIVLAEMESVLEVVLPNALSPERL